MTSTRTWRMAIASMAALVVFATSCSSGSDDATQASRDADATAGESAAGSEVATGVPDGEPVGREREIVYTGSLSLRVDDVEAASERAADVAEAAGGYLAGQRAELAGERSATVTLRVPSEAFDGAMAELAALGVVRDRAVGSDDVTDQVVDLEERLENARASADRLRELLGEAENLQNVIAIEDRLTQRETEIESLTGQLEVLGDRAALATIEVAFVERDDPAVSDDLPGPLEALRAGVVALANVTLVLAAAVAFALPFAPFAALGWYLARRVRRGRARRRLPPPPG